MTVNDFQKYLILKYGKRHSGVIALDEEHQVITERDAIANKEKYQLIMSIAFLVIGGVWISDYMLFENTGKLPLGSGYLILSFMFLFLYAYKKGKSTLIIWLYLTHQKHSFKEMLNEVNRRNTKRIAGLTPITDEEVENAANLGSAIDNWRAAVVALFACITLTLMYYSYAIENIWLFCSTLTTVLLTFIFTFKYLLFIYRRRLIQLLYLFKLTF